MKKIVILGAGGNSKVIIDILFSSADYINKELEILGILDDDCSKKELMGYPVLGNTESIYELKTDKDIYFINGVGNNYTREKIYNEYKGIKWYTAIHTSAIIGTGVEIGEGTVIMPGAIVNVDSRIGKNVIINTGAIIEHDNIIDDFAHLASGTTTAGNVRVGKCTMLGTGTKVIQGISIGTCTLVGAGSVVVKDIPDHCTAMGVPAKVKGDM
ncbi:MAG TPA: acetyltransferase [Anaerovoracaceae bacterium]|nr:acetyltransferase [Anaerovoracaceae bacterium]